MGEGKQRWSDDGNSYRCEVAEVELVGGETMCIPLISWSRRKSNRRREARTSILRNPRRRRRRRGKKPGDASSKRHICLCVSIFSDSADRSGMEGKEEER